MVINFEIVGTPPSEATFPNVTDLSVLGKYPHDAEAGRVDFLGNVVDGLVANKQE